MIRKQLQTTVRTIRRAQQSGADEHRNAREFKKPRRFSHLAGLFAHTDHQQ